MHDRRESIMMKGFSIEDDLGIVYVVENAQQFWSELEDLVHIPKDHIPTLELLDGILKRFVGFCACYHEQYLQSPLQLEHACNLILDSELFAFHSERMCDILSSEAKTSTNPHFQLISLSVLLHFGMRRTAFYRSTKRWRSLLPLLMDHVLVDIDSDVEDAYLGVTSSSSGGSNVPVPIEAKLRSLGMKMLYEVCRVQKLSLQDLEVFDDAFLDYLFDLVEQTRLMQDDTFNYTVIKLIVALNEQFMVVSVNDSGTSDSHDASSNRVLAILMRRLNSSKTFAENMIFMLNRAQHTPEDLCMQLLVLKLIYLIFTSKGTSEYFYTNDLCVLVDVILREIVDLDEDNEPLRHTYLRVLHPLLTKTQLRDVPYKRPQILRALESLAGLRDAQFGYMGGRDVNPTTRRLVERCLGGDWCVQLRKLVKEKEDVSSEISQGFANLGLETKPGNHKTIKTAKSMEFRKSKPVVPGPASSHATSTSSFVQQQQAPPLPSVSPILYSHSAIPPGSPVRHVSGQRRPSDASVYSTSSALSLTGVANATVPNVLIDGIPTSPSVDSLHTTPIQHKQARRAATDLEPNGNGHSEYRHHQSASSDSTLTVTAESDSPRKQRRTAPPPPGPPKRRPPPAVPVRSNNTPASRVVFTSIKSSAGAG